MAEEKLIVMNRLCGVALTLCPLVAGAQTCAAPIPVIFNTVITGNTCSSPTGTGSNSLSSYGGTPSPQTEVIYSFVYPGINGTAAIVDPGAFGAAIFLMPSPCSTSTDPINFGFPGTPMLINGLTPGQTYYVIVTADPAGPSAACGAYSLLFGGFLEPVELQQFSVD